MKKYFFYFALIFITINIYSQSSKPRYLFKIATDAPQNSTWYQALKAINKELYFGTNKEVAMQLYAGGVMGNQTTVIKKIKLGQLSGATFSNSGLQIIYKDFNIVGFPLMIRSEEDYDYFKQQLGPFFEQKLNEKGFKLLGWSETGPIYVFSKKPVNSAGTLRNSKPFVLEGDNTSLALFKEIKATPVPLDTSDILTSLQTGQIDTVFSPPYGLISLQWSSKVNYMADFPITFMIGAVVVDRELFDSMPKNYQKLMLSLFRKHFKSLTQKIRAENDNALLALKKYGIKFLEVPEEEKKVFYDVCNKTNLFLLKSEGLSMDVYKKVNDTMLKRR